MAETTLKELTETFVLTYDHEQVIAENARLQAQLDTAMTTLRQIAETPRNRGARRNANATVRFLEAMTPNAAMSGEPKASPLDPSEELGIITREEWERRYAARIMDRAGWPERAAMHAARVGADCYEEDERKPDQNVVWWGGPSGDHMSPEDMADAELCGVRSESE